MIAKKEWFKIRKYGGWGVAPKTWQGWVYIICVIGVLALLQFFSQYNNFLNMIFIGIWLLYLFLEIIPIMIFLKKDELEKKVEAISERNASWFMSMTLVLGVLYESFYSAFSGEFNVNWFLIIALFGGALVKTLSNLILEKKGLNEN